MKSRGSRKKSKQNRSYARYAGVAFGVLVVAVIVYGMRPRSDVKSASTSVRASGAVTFVDARRQAAEFIAYDGSIALTPAQKQIMHDALSSIPAPCCSEFSIETCCCPCNLAKSTWGLSKTLIANHHATAAEVKAAALAWIQFINPEGYDGKVCADQECNSSYENGGCGGMDSRYVR